MWPVKGITDYLYTSFDNDKCDTAFFANTSVTTLIGTVPPQLNPVH